MLIQREQRYDMHFEHFTDLRKCLGGKMITLERHGKQE